MKNRFKNRYSPVLFLITLFVILSALIRFVLAIWVASDLDWKFTSIVTTFLFGFLYDISVISCFSLVFVFYLLCMPNKWRNSWLDRSVVYVLFFLFVLLFYFSFFAEITFWDEFKSRFNFIAVDYLI